MTEQNGGQRGPAETEERPEDEDAPGTVSTPVDRDYIDWILIAARVVGTLVIIFGVANVVNVAVQTRSAGPGAIDGQWLQFAASAAGSVSTGLLLIVAAEILGCLRSVNSR